MSAPKKSITARFFIGLWTLLNFVRNAFFNIIFIIIGIGIIAAVTSGEDEIKVPKGSALILKLTGNIVEQKRAVDPMEEFVQEVSDSPGDAPEVLLSDVILAIDNAKQDKRIKALVLDLSRMGWASLNKLNEIGKALDEFKASEKPVYAIGDYYSQTQYYLASYADKVYLNPEGGILFQGYGRYRMYYKSAIEKLKAKAHIFRVGTFKSATEPYFRDDMSEAAKQANIAWTGELWEQYKTAVAQRRNVDVSNFDETIAGLKSKLEQANGDLAAYALANGWVDELKTREQVREEFASIVGDEDKAGDYKSISFKKYLKVLKRFPPFVNPDTDKVAIIVAKGTILDGRQKAGTIGGDSTAALLRKARLNDKVKAVVLRVDSPGGSAFASEIIRQEIELIKASGKPVVASMSGYAASGGYWISASADQIWAAPSTITGSIGIYGMFLSFEDTLKTIGVYTDGVGTTELYNFGNPMSAMSEEAGSIIQLIIERGYRQFIGLVAKERDMTPEQVDEIAQGRVWTGAKAKELGLVDELGNLQDAITAAADLAKLEKYDTLLVEKGLSPKEQFLKEMFGTATAMVASDDGVAKQPGTLMKLFKQLATEVDKTAQLNDPKGVYAHCIPCEI